MSFRLKSLLNIIQKEINTETIFKFLCIIIFFFPQYLKLLI